MTLISFHRRHCSISGYNLLLLVVILSAATRSIAMIADYDASDYEVTFIPWGARCKIPAGGELLLPHDGCDGTKGIICQKYSQGNYCGCPIESPFLSYDKRSGECRRKPGELCKYVNTTAHPDIYDKLPRIVKCHQAAECVKRLVTSSEALAKPTTKEESKCVCRWGYLVSRDGLSCDSVNKSASLFSSGQERNVIVLSNLLGLIFLLRWWQ
ncbi:uncharacterized protein LOC110862586 [Folsomia candida]|uniref:Uncharacterized protein n=1 Tax=Folsomia candida TaxID=158441 RepID=A0A226CWD0_FOLCA|nr:uncharacterized protein LOC110862586 [Folsomia candida]XP_021967497.1 uncharacterized protein LOC110862586 [Folsomia candida]XP_021967498.1 uncharacterized protein LOC110862586 [Folsomia candida]XP_035701573.1 uncharacterized protein LOC110862586 [Folsomia candida]XP_035701574.1 uncharacterized protein LOC110862586 [Folsomia candida]OXA37249.1 hypothetical protein Fcan01_27978 [Folsomia candida]